MSLDWAFFRLGSGKLTRSFWTMPKVADPKGQVLHALLEEREVGS